MVGHRAGVPIGTFGAVQRLVGAAFFAGADVLAAVIAVVAKVDQVAAYCVWFIDVAIAVVVDSVAYLSLRGSGVAGGETLGGADPLAAAGAEFVGHFAAGPEQQIDGFLSTRAGAGFGDALVGGETVNGGAFRTNETGWAEGSALIFRRALSAAKAPLFAIVDAEVVGPGWAGTALPRMAGFAEVRKVRNAREEEVGATGVELLALPTWWAFLDA